MRGTLAEPSRATPAVAPPARARRSPQLRAALLTAGPPAVVLLIAGLLWRLWVGLAHVPSYLVPAPEAVVGKLAGDPGFFIEQGWVTLREALLGLALGGGAALLLAVLLAHSRPLERGLLPLAIAVKVTPIVAVAPLLTIWFGFGLAPKVLVAALIAFFPILVNGVIGFRAVNPTALDLLRSLDASTAQIFFKLRLWSALPYLFSALKVSITLALIGALVGEWNGASAGLGQVILLAHNNLEMANLFAAIIALVILGVGLTQAVSLLERRLLTWHDAFRDESV